MTDSVNLTEIADILEENSRLSKAVEDAKAQRSWLLAELHNSASSITKSAPSSSAI